MATERVPREIWAKVLPNDWRAKSFMDGVRFAAKFAAIIALDNRSEDETSQQGMIRFATALDELANDPDQ